MIPLISLSEPLLAHMRVNLSRRHISMAQHQLNGYEVRFVVQHMRREAMAQVDSALSVHKTTD